MCHTSPSVADFELCEPEKKNSPVLRTLVSRLTSTRSQAGNLSTLVPAPTLQREKIQLLQELEAATSSNVGSLGFSPLCSCTFLGSYETPSTSITLQLKTEMLNS